MSSERTGAVWAKIGQVKTSDNEIGLRRGHAIEKSGTMGASRYGNGIGQEIGIAFPLI